MRNIMAVTSLLSVVSVLGPPIQAERLAKKINNPEADIAKTKKRLTYVGTEVRVTGEHYTLNSLAKQINNAEEFVYYEDKKEAVCKTNLILDVLTLKLNPGETLRMAAGKCLIMLSGKLWLAGTPDSRCKICRLSREGSGLWRIEVAKGAILKMQYSDIEYYDGRRARINGIIQSDHCRFISLVGGFHLRYPGEGSYITNSCFVDSRGKQNLLLYVARHLTISDCSFDKPVKVIQTKVSFSDCTWESDGHNLKLSKERHPRNLHLITEVTLRNCVLNGNIEGPVLGRNLAELMNGQLGTTRRGNQEKIKLYFSGDARVKKAPIDLKVTYDRVPASADQQHTFTSIVVPDEKVAYLKLNNFLSSLILLKCYLVKEEGILKDIESRKIEAFTESIVKLGAELGNLKRSIDSIALQDEETIKEYTRAFSKLDKMASQLRVKVAKAQILAHREMKEAGFGIGVETSMRKVWFDETYTGPIADTVKIGACGGEYEGFQVIILPFEKNLEKVEVSTTDLVREDGKATISRDNIACRPVGYVELEKSKQPKYREKTFWPDPLLNEQRFNVPKGNVQPVWITIFVPEGSKPGNYTSKLTISAGNARKLDVDIGLKVWNFTLPKERHLWNEFNLSRNALWKVMGIRRRELMEDKKTEEEAIKVYKRYLNFLLAYRGNSAAAGSGMESRGRTPWPVIQKEDGGYDFSLMNDILQYCIERGQTHFWINQYGRILWSARDETYRAELRKFLREYTDNLRAKGWLGKGYFYNFDEPHCSGGGSAQEKGDTIREVVKVSRECCPDLKHMCTTSTHTRETPRWKSLYGYIDLWISRGSTLSEEQRAKGEKAIWYGFSTWTDRINLRGIAPRCMYWLSWKTQTDGYGWDWCNKWQRLGPYEGQEGSSGWPRIAGHVKASGTGMIFYHGKDVDAQPIASIRIENMRDGCEDFEYFHLLREKIKIAKARKGQEPLRRLCQEAEQLLRIPENIIKDADRNIADPCLILKHREKVAEKIETLNQALK